MKRSILMLLVMSAALIFFGCEKTDPQSESVNDLETASLKGAKARTFFTGTSVPVAPISDGDATPLPNGKLKITGVSAEWYDHSEDGPLVTGKTFWTGNYLFDGEFLASPGKAWGKTELWVYDPENVDPDAEPIGKWDMTWHGYQTELPEGGFELIAYAVGQGKEGIVKGMTAKWVYTFDWGTFTYRTSGYYK